MKLAIAGAPGSGKLEILEAVSARHGAEPPRPHRCGDIVCHRAQWLDADRLGDGRRLHILVQTLQGKVPYNAAEELMLREADGVVFVIDTAPDRLKDAWEALMRASDNAQRNGYELRAVPFALQYHRADRHPGFEPSKLDAWLGIPGGEVPRFVTSSASPDLEGMAFDKVLGELLKRLPSKDAA